MFTGLVQSLGTVDSLQSAGPGCRLSVRSAEIAGTAGVGESIAVNGCCLTLVGTDRGLLEFDVGPETLIRTNLGQLKPECRINLERSLRAGDLLGGHFVTGHVDGLAVLAARQDDREWSTCWFSADRALCTQMVSKGSVTLDGVSLTLVEVDAERFSVALIPHTLSQTTLGTLEVGSRVNLETDLIAKYVQRALLAVR